MSTRKPKPRPRPPGQDGLTDQQKRILKKVKAKEQALNDRMWKAERQHRYRKRCVDARICPECGSELIYNSGWFLIFKYKKSTCTCNHCGYEWVFRGSGVGPGRL